MASQKIRIKLMSYDVEMLDSVVGVVTDSGMSDIYSVTYDVSNRSDLYKQALELAIDAAAKKADVMARLRRSWKPCRNRVRK